MKFALILATISLHAYLAGLSAFANEAQTTCGIGNNQSLEERALECQKAFPKTCDGKRDPLVACSSVRTKHPTKKFSHDPYDDITKQWQLVGRYSNGSMDWLDNNKSSSGKSLVWHMTLGKVIAKGEVQAFNTCSDLSDNNHSYRLPSFDEAQSAFNNDFAKITRRDLAGEYGLYDKIVGVESGFPWVYLPGKKSGEKGTTGVFGYWGDPSDGYINSFDEMEVVCVEEVPLQEQIKTASVIEHNLSGVNAELVNLGRKQSASPSEGVSSQGEKALLGSPAIAPKGTAQQETSVSKAI
jgi:hypothetical protein